MNPPVLSPAGFFMPRVKAAAAWSGCCAHHLVFIVIHLNLTKSA